MKLSEIQTGERVRVNALHLDPDACRRLQSLGMLPGTPLEILHRKKSGTMVVLLRGNRFALGSDMTRGIEVDHD